MGVTLHYDKSYWEISAKFNILYILILALIIWVNSMCLKWRMSNNFLSNYILNVTSAAKPKQILNEKFTFFNIFSHKPYWNDMCLLLSSGPCNSGHFDTKHLHIRSFWTCIEHSNRTPKPGFSGRFAEKWKMVAIATRDHIGNVSLAYIDQGVILYHSTKFVACITMWTIILLRTWTIRNISFLPRFSWKDIATMRCTLYFVLKIN